MNLQQLRLWHFMQAVSHTKMTREADDELAGYHKRKAKFHICTVQMLSELPDLMGKPTVEEDYDASIDAAVDQGLIEHDLETNPLEDARHE